MLARWLARDRILKQAVTAVLAGILCLVISGGLGAWDYYQHRWPGEGHDIVSEAVWQYGATSPEAAASVKQLGESPHPKDVVALLDPTTGKAISAWPADMVGKRPDEMLLPGGAKLPAIDKLVYRQHFKLRAADGSTDRPVQVTPFYPWSRHGAEPPAVGSSAAVAKPEAVLLIATPPEPVHVLRVLSGVFAGMGAVAFVVLQLSLAWWVFADARRRGSSRAFAWGTLTLLTGLVGAAVYMVARREERHCGSCGSAVERGFNHCPHCGRTLKRLCPQCGHHVWDGWTYCVSCGTPYEASPVVATD